MYTSVLVWLILVLVAALLVGVTHRTRSRNIKVTFDKPRWFFPGFSARVKGPAREKRPSDRTGP